MEVLMSQIVHLVMSISRNCVIGHEGEMLWSLPEVEKRFKTMTLGHVVVMGRKTWEDLPFKPLPGRDCIVLTSNEKYEPAGAQAFTSFEDVLQAFPDREIWVLGGKSVFDEAVKHAHVLHAAMIDGEFKGDTSFDLPSGTVTKEVTSELLGEYEDVEANTWLSVTLMNIQLK